jgi:hypothetical protein
MKTKIEYKDFYVFENTGLNIIMVITYIMKNIITTFLKRIMPKELPKHLGRWSMENCDKKINYKIDLSNEDHCGPCGQYALTQMELKKNKIKNKKSITEK